MSRIEKKFSIRKTKFNKEFKISTSPTWQIKTLPGPGGLSPSHLEKFIKTWQFHTKFKKFSQQIDFEVNWLEESKYNKSRQLSVWQLIVASEIMGILLLILSKSS